MRGIFQLVGIAFGVFLFLVILTATFSFIRHAWFGGFSGPGSHVRIVEVAGVLMNSQPTVDELELIGEDRHVKAVVLRVNSPGGLVAPSQEIYEALKKLDAKKPVVTSMASLAASGGYYISLGTRKIFANSGTLTGSIGVIMEFLNTQKLYQWAMLDRFAITSGKFKDAGSPFKAMTLEDKALFQTMVKDIYAQFRGAVKERRKLGEEELDKVTDGRVLTGHQAKEAKLVDALGTLEDAIADAKKLANLPESADVIYPEKKQGLLRKLLMGDEEESEGSINELSKKLTQALPPTREAWRLLWLAPVY